MSRLDQLPMDLTIIILCYAHDLDDLHALVSCCRVCRDAFSCQRALVLRRVFSTSISMCCRHQRSNKTSSEYFADYPLEEVQWVQNITNKCTSNKDDQLQLDMAGWQTMLRLHPSTTFCCWGSHLVRRQMNTLGLERSRGFVEQLWTQMAASPLTARNDLLRRKETIMHKRCFIDIAQKLTSMYLEFQYVDKAIGVIQRYCDTTPSLVVDGLIAIVQSYHRKLDEQQKQILLTFLADQVEKERAELRRFGYQVLDMPSATQHEWALCLIGVLQESEKVTEACEVLRSSMDFARQYSVDPAPVVWLSRAMISMYRKSGQVNELLEARQIVTDMLRPMTTATASRYVAWVAEYTNDLVLSNRKEQAVAVNETLWVDIRDRLVVSRNLGLIEDARKAARALYKAYKNVNNDRAAENVQRAYVDLVSHTQ